jgi:hypothetical protein
VSLTIIKGSKGMKANPGGQIDLKEVVGRDNIIEEIWDTLEQQSIRMTAERRIGKTTIIMKLRGQPRDGWVPIFQDLEKNHTALEFARSVFDEVEKYLSKSQKTARHTRKLLESLGGAEVGGFFKFPTFKNNAPWKEILTHAIQDIVESAEKQSKRTLLLWDEVPLMLEGIKKREGELVAIEVLDIMRELRQTYGSRGLRMVITGSIGLHHVIKGFKQQHYSNAPVNDALSVPIPPLDFASAQELASKLIVGEKIKTQSLENTAKMVAEVSDCFPFYIHHIIKAMKLSGKEGNPATVDEIVLQQLLAADDPWELNHYRERISTYYGKEYEKATLDILDALALEPKAMSINNLLINLKNTGALDDREKLIELLKLIEQDHYLSKNNDGHYYFQFPLLQRWWKLSRGL